MVTSNIQSSGRGCQTGVNCICSLFMGSLFYTCSPAHRGIGLVYSCVHMTRTCCKSVFIFASACDVGEANCNYRASGGSVLCKQITQNVLSMKMLTIKTSESAVPK